MKRGLSIFTLLLASAILLVHVVMPHHHHDEDVCFVNTHCDGEAEASGDADHDHEHDGSRDIEHCVLEQLVVLPAGTNEFDKKLIPAESKTDFICQQAVSTDIPYGNSRASYAWMNSVRGSLSIIPGHTVSGPGLRAPPIV